MEPASPETAERVYRHLTNQANAGGYVSVSIRDVADALSIGRSTACRALGNLLENQTVQVARKGTGHLYPTTYYVHGGAI